MLKQKRSALCAAVSLASLLTLGVVNAMPIVPVSVITEVNESKAPPRIPEPVAPQQSKEEGAFNTEGTIVMRQGVNEIVPVAVTHMNRIVTPFPNPEVKYGPGGEVQIESNIIYIATDSTSPITLFINEEGIPDVALNLTLVPRRIPAREIVLKLSDSVGMFGSFGSQKADRWEKSQPYVDVIRNLFRGIALGDIPPGYTLGSYPSKRPTPQCAMDGLSFNFKKGQLVTGRNLQVSIGVVENKSNKTIEFLESVCGGWNVQAVAAWPNIVLAPGQKTEVFVAERINQQIKSVNKRPSLIGGGR